MAKAKQTTEEVVETEALHYPSKKESKPKFKWKGTTEFRHDLFKLELSHFKKNISYQKYTPQLHDVEHVHFYHSHDSKGRPQKYCSAVGGHFHEMTVEVTPSGDLVAKSGPALKHVVKRQKNGKPKTLIEKVTFYDGDEDNKFFDEHTHEVMYLESDMLSEEKLKQNLRHSAEKLETLSRAQPKQ